MSLPTRIFLDTNIYIVGNADPTSDEGRILAWLGFAQESPSSNVVVIISQALLEQVSRVSRRLYNKDEAGKLLDQILGRLQIDHVLLNAGDIQRLEALGTVPREDITVYLSAKIGKAQCFISANHKLIRALVEQIQEFECLTPAEFVQRYL